MSDVERRREDGFSAIWPILGFILGLICEVLASAGKFDALIQLSLLPVILIGFVAAVVWLGALLWSAYRHRWKRFVSALTAIPAALMTMPGLWSDFDLASEVRLIANRAGYDRQIAALSEPIGRRRIGWYWGGNTTAITGGELYRLVYDETASLPKSLCSDDPWPPTDRPWCGQDRSEFTARRLWGHLYLVSRNVR